MFRLLEKDVGVQSGLHGDVCEFLHHADRALSLDVVLAGGVHNQRPQKPDRCACSYMCTLFCNQCDELLLVPQNDGGHGSSHPKPGSQRLVKLSKCLNTIAGNAATNRIEMLPSVIQLQTIFCS